MALREVYRSTVFVFGAYVGLADAEDPDVMPYDWDEHDGLYAYDPGGILVGAAPDSYVEIVVAAGDEIPDGTLLVSTHIIVGGGGLWVGTGEGEIETISWQRGRARLKVYCEGERRSPHRVTFVLREPRQRTGRRPRVGHVVLGSRLDKS